MTKYSYTLVVEDIEKSVAFYQQYFNWNADRKGKESAAGTDWSIRSLSER